MGQDMLRDDDDNDKPVEESEPPIQISPDDSDD